MLLADVLIFLLNPTFHSNSHKKAPPEHYWWSFSKNLMLEVQIKITSLKDRNYFMARLRLWLEFVKERKPL